ncbi:tRNA (adenosine(37)-N6)-threonylcarbamoyltransferase complex dimerization subunit type 1 TsaB [Hydrogenovibrio sp. 3SP14C1]|uniref:tRNA (adenosine(37)-N6)-threonylcarbamoyltransferase complex dimerization subunit type 1 TsaB n=1 Tax=Hydrogenovibrio sp. 3SP14C1 TaxID=3038774 RepID=UPI002417B877|nr:tRNA (adenosine(37)-N6)-threonylcarbamoyltransferase complex dimerization subunit type 1 TsaB [Hydrogenovibrio sp. 3SP14C1]MDG4812829.1 tRNA (adenosine(37)-N6)-threonylcarbamoyltransferase complex dimerization subunit type 1 TsaB [Hydrogenovibrio sp. 3SP14C1]
MNVLAVESSTKACSVCLKAGDTVYVEFEMAPQRHANLMLPMVEKVLNQSGLTSDKIDVLAFSEGPGAFTGIRIAAGVIQGLSLGWGKPVLPVSTLEALAWQAYKETGQTEWIACLDARMKEIYVQSCHIEAGRLISTKAQLSSQQQLLEMLKTNTIKNGVGDIEPEYPEIVSMFENWHGAYPSAEAIADIAQQRFDQAKALDEEIPLPVYLRNNVADKPAAMK